MQQMLLVPVFDWERGCRHAAGSLPARNAHAWGQEGVLSEARLVPGGGPALGRRPAQTAIIAAEASALLLDTGDA